MTQEEEIRAIAGRRASAEDVARVRSALAGAAGAGPMPYTARQAALATLASLPRRTAPTALILALLLGLVAVAVWLAIPQVPQWDVVLAAWPGWFWSVADTGSATAVAWTAVGVAGAAAAIWHAAEGEPPAPWSPPR